MWLEQRLISILNKFGVRFYAKDFLNNWEAAIVVLLLWELIVHDREIFLSQWSYHLSFVLLYEGLQFSGLFPLITIPYYRLFLFFAVPIPFSLPLSHYIIEAYALISKCSFHILFIYPLTSLCCLKDELFDLQLWFLNSHFNGNDPTFEAPTTFSKRDP
jgi:hypothetical protein